PKCDGAPNAGLVSSSDSVNCTGYFTHLFSKDYTTTAHGIERIWQYSPDNIVWGDIVGSENLDTLKRLFNNTEFYRIKATCSHTGRFSLSNTIRVLRGNGYECYCLSHSLGGTNDST